MAEPVRIQRFVVERVLGEGGMGAVYQAFDPQLERSVAIKLLTIATVPDTALDDHRTLDLRDGNPAHDGDDLLTEARMMAQISHPNVLPIYEVGRHGNSIFLVMELIDGADLRRWLNDAARTTSEILDVVIAALRGLAAAHARGILHRDFKPDNVLIGSDGRVCVADFGVSSLIGRPVTKMTRVGDHRGTPAYMAPELWDGHDASPASDVYAVALTAVEALVPDAASARGATLERKLVERGVPPSIRSALRIALADAPAQRPQDASALLAMLRTRERRTRWWILATTVAVVGTATAGMVMMRRDDAPTCINDPARLVRAWSAARAAAIRAAVTALDPELAPAIDAEIADVELELATENRLRLQACRDRSASKLGVPQHAARTGCLDRRLIDLEVRGDALLAGTVARPVVAGTLRIPSFDSCTHQRGQPLAAGDRARQIAVSRAFFANLDTPNRASIYAAIETDALAIGDLELAARAAGIAAEAHGKARALGDARAAFQRGREHAQTLAAPDVELKLVTGRARFELAYGELDAAGVLADDALGLLARAVVAPKAQLHALGTVARIFSQHGDARRAIPVYERAIAAAQAAGVGTSVESLELRLTLLQEHRAVATTPEEREELGTLASKTLAIVEAALPRDHATVRRALFVTASALTHAGDKVGGMTLQQRGFALLRDAKPAEGQTPVQTEFQLAGELVMNGLYLEGISRLRTALADADAAATDLGAATLRGQMLAVLGMALMIVGEWRESRGVLEDALLETTNRGGADHPLTRQVLESLIEVELLTGDLDRATRHTDLLERQYQAEGARGAVARASMHGSVRARIAEMRGDLAGAERWSAEALAALTELKATPKQRANAVRQQARLLAARGRYAEAAAQFEVARRQVESRSPLGCLDEIEQARSERLAGVNEIAERRARDVLDVLAAYPAYAARHAELQAWLDQRQ